MRSGRRREEEEQVGGGKGGGERRRRESKEQEEREGRERWKEEDRGGASGRRGRRERRGVCLCQLSLCLVPKTRQVTLLIHMGYQESLKISAPDSLCLLGSVSWSTCPSMVS